MDSSILLSNSSYQFIPSPQNLNCLSFFVMLFQLNIVLAHEREWIQLDVTVFMHCMEEGVPSLIDFIRSKNLPGHLLPLPTYLQMSHFNFFYVMLQYSSCKPEPSTVYLQCSSFLLFQPEFCNNLFIAKFL